MPSSFIDFLRFLTFVRTEPKSVPLSESAIFSIDVTIFCIASMESEICDEDSLVNPPTKAPAALPKASPRPTIIFFIILRPSVIVFSNPGILANTPFSATNPSMHSAIVSIARPIEAPALTAPAISAPIPPMIRRAAATAIRATLRPSAIGRTASGFGTLLRIAKAPAAAIRATPIATAAPIVSPNFIPSSIFNEAPAAKRAIPRATAIGITSFGLLPF